MITYKTCSKVSKTSIYEGFQIGFSDYIIPTKTTEEDFFHRFFGPEGNKLEYSFIALDGSKPIGVILSGLKMYEGIKTMRCGALAIHPDYRGQKVSQTLFALHKEAAIQHNCKQLFLEVIVGNNRAIQFYRKLGYEKVYDLRYFQLHDYSISMLSNACSNESKIQEISFTTFKDKIKNDWLHFHINWQNDLDYMEQTDTNTYFGAYHNNKLIGCLCINNAGKISFLYTSPSYRQQGVALSLLQTAYKMLQLTTVSISFPNNASLEGFAKKIGFIKSEIEQFEMYHFL